MVPRPPACTHNCDQSVADKTSKKARGTCVWATGTILLIGVVTASHGVGEVGIRFPYTTVVCTHALCVLGLLAAPYNRLPRVSAR